MTVLKKRAIKKRQKLPQRRLIDKRAERRRVEKNVETVIAIDDLSDRAPKKEHLIHKPHNFENLKENSKLHLNWGTSLNWQRETRPRRSDQLSRRVVPSETDVKYTQSPVLVEPLILNMASFNDETEIEHQNNREYLEWAVDKESSRVCSARSLRRSGYESDAEDVGFEIKASPRQGRVYHEDRGERLEDSAEWEESYYRRRRRVQGELDRLEKQNIYNFHYNAKNKSRNENVFVMKKNEVKTSTSKNAKIWSKQERLLENYPTTSKSEN